MRVRFPTGLRSLAAGAGERRLRLRLPSMRGLLDMSIVERLVLLAEAVVLVGAVGSAVLLSHEAEWQPTSLLAVVIGLTVVGHWLSVSLRAGRLNASLVALVLAMALLGPAPAVALGLTAMIITSALRRLSLAHWLNNLSTFALVPLAGGLMVRAIAGDVHQPSNAHYIQSITFGLVVMAMFIATVALNFVLVALESRLSGGPSLARQAQDMLLPMLPGQLATGALATILTVAYTNSGLPVLFAAIVVLVIFQQLTAALLRSEDRADQLEARTIHLVSLQLGVLRTLVRALGMRDDTTARHSASVARYARELAKVAGAGQDEQDTVHTAGLLHDIGKFTWPDRVLHATAVAPEDEAVVKRHPQDGAELVGALDGYGPVADTILYHHERVDGSGYPAGLIGKEIPLTSRILAICCVFDTMTKRASYRPPMSIVEGLQELRGGAAHGQFDPELVELFVGLIEGSGASLTQEESVDFEAELSFEQRVRQMAQPAG